jgi:hypothetical protein
VTKPRKLTIMGLVACVAAGTAVALAQSGDNVPVPAAALNDASRAPTADPSSAAGLADAVNRWATEARPFVAGTPLTSRATDLVAGLGRDRDAVTAFATSRGWVCYEIRGAGTCGRLDTPSGVTFAIFSTRSGGARLFGVASDRVARVQVQVHGVLSDALLRNNAIYFELPVGLGSEAVQQLRVTFADGSTHRVQVHG